MKFYYVLLRRKFQFKKKEIIILIFIFAPFEKFSTFPFSFQNKISLMQVTRYLSLK